jgi:predicted GIY-YIG superfamily endonuclease
MPVSVYWIHHKDHTDVFNQGYIGVSNNTEKRFAKHKTHVNNNKHINPMFANVVKKYGWDNLVKEVILIADKEYCLAIESKLRNTKEIGWNIAPGGGMPDVKFGDKNPMRNPIVAAKTAATKKGIATRGFGWKHSEETRKKLSKNAGNKGVGRKVVVNGISFISQTAAAKHFGVHIRTFKKRFKLVIL